MKPGIISLPPFAQGLFARGARRVFFAAGFGFFNS
jgi:hypothetical protein